MVYILPSGPVLLDKDIPSHPVLRLVSRSEERLSLKVSRHLISMEKCGIYDASKSTEYRAFTYSTIQTFSLEEADAAYQKMRTFL